MSQPSQPNQPEDPQPGAPGNLPAESDDAAWKLLGEARHVAPGPGFTARVVAEARRLSSSAPETGGTRSKIIPFPLPRLAYAAAALILLSLAVLQVLRTPAPSGGEIVAAPETSSPPAEAVASATPPPAADPLLEDPAAAQEDPYGEYQDELEIIDYLDGLLAVGDIQSLTDDDLAELLF